MELTDQNSALFDRSECKRLAKRLRAGLGAIGVVADPKTPIGGMIADLEWIASLDREPFDDGGAEDQNPARLAKAFQRSVQARQIADLLENCAVVENSEGILRRHIPQQIDRTDSLEEQAQDFLFEVEMAGRLALWQSVTGFDISMEEPDIVVRLTDDDETVPLPLACKRPRSRNSMRGSLRKARKQLKRAGPGGVAVVSLDLLLGDDDQPLVLEVETAGDIDVAARDVVETLVSEIEDDVRQELGPMYAGVLFAANVLFKARDEPGLGYYWIGVPVPNPHVPNAETQLDTLQKLLFRTPPRE